jgi:hypothetical protein
MSKTCRPYEPDQVWLLPPALTDWLPETQLVCFLCDVVEGLDLSAIKNGVTLPVFISLFLEAFM